MRAGLGTTVQQVAHIGQDVEPRLVLGRPAGLRVGDELPVAVVCRVEVEPRVRTRDALLPSEDRDDVGVDGSVQRWRREAKDLALVGRPDALGSCCELGERRQGGILALLLGCPLA